MEKILNRLLVFLKDRPNLILFFILALAAFLRLWNIGHLFNAFHDADEGVYAMNARMIALGHLPYKDFVMVHPPFYEFVLAAVYKIFGYSFLYGRYVSVALSIASICIAYIIMRKAYHPTAGIIAAILFAVYPEIVYWGRSLTQESLGIFLIISAIYLAFSFRWKNSKHRLVISGVLLGLAVATKYTFIPAVFGIVAGVIVMNGGKRLWYTIICPIAKISFWLVYLGLLALVIALLAVSEYTLGWQISIPLINSTTWSVMNSVILVIILILPFIASFLLMYGLTFARERASKILYKCNKITTAWLILGIFTGFLTVTGFFWITMPQAYIQQTFSMQLQQTAVFPSLPTLLSVALSPRGYIGTGNYFILLTIPAIVFLLRKRSFKLLDIFLAPSMLTTLFFCQWFGYISRYYVSIFPFFILVIASFTPRLDSSIIRASLNSIDISIKGKLVIILGMLILFLSLSSILIVRNPVYDTNMTLYSSDENRVYTDTINYLETVGAKKICAPNQILPALAPKFATSMNIDYYAFRKLDHQPPDKIIQDEIDQGTDYIVLDYWFRHWQDSWTQQMLNAIYNHSRLVAIIDPYSEVATDIYWLKAPSGIIDGQFDKWANNGLINSPFGWLPMYSFGENEETLPEETDKQGVKCADLRVVTNGPSNTDNAYMQLLQYIPFPNNNITIRALPVQTTQVIGTDIVGPSVQFFDHQGHVLAMGFSSQINTEQVNIFPGGKKILILQESNPDQWKDYTLNITSYWTKAGWEKPKSIGVYIKNSTTKLGTFTFYISEITEERSAEH